MKKWSAFLCVKDVRVWLTEISTLICTSATGGFPSHSPAFTHSSPAMQETCSWPLSQEDPLEKGMATHSNILAWRTHRQRRLVGYNPWGHKESDMTEQLTPSLASSLCFHILGSSGLSYGVAAGSDCSLIATRWQVFFPFWVPSGLISSPSTVAAIAGDCDILVY